MDFHTMLKKSIEDEKEGISRYKELAQLAPEEYAPIIRDIEKEETHHLKFLEKIAEEMGEQRRNFARKRHISTQKTHRKNNRNVRNPDESPRRHERKSPRESLSFRL